MFNDLNDKQKQAVFTTKHKVLVVAGAGSGKTKVLTNRIVKLLNDGVNPNEILAFTFTNKASKEMKDRISKVSSFDNVYTFHSFCYEIIRDLYYLLGFNEIPSIIDESDKSKIIKGIINDLGIEHNPSTYLEYISKIKNHSFESKKTEDYKIIMNIFNLYQKELRKYSYIDFDDMVYLVVENFKMINEASDYIRNIKYILVDECQDTNPIQYELINKLSYTNSYIFMVGDEDQLIYSFRNSNIVILRDFKEKCDEIIILNQNYRCSKNILEAANNLISHNTNRMDKLLYSNIEEKYPIKIHEFESNLDEAKGISIMVEKLHNRGFEYEDIAILYRNNNQSYVIERELLKKDIPYTTFGSKPIYKYKEVKQILSSYRFIYHPNDLIAFINQFDLDQNILDDFKKKYKDSILDLIEFGCIYKNKTINDISKGIKVLIDKKYNYNNEQLFNSILDVLKIKESINNSNNKNETWDRINSLRDIFNDDSNIDDLLNKIYLESDKKIYKGVNLLTIHKSKGLEFKAVFIIGCNEGVFPLKKADIEEERRLMYVAITRAKNCLMISHINCLNNKQLNSLFLIDIKRLK